MTPPPVFPFTDAQVGEVADALYDFDGPSDAGRHAEREVRVEQATAALTALARVLRVEHNPDPQEPPRGSGWRAVRGVTEWFRVP
jgi:hypothetical protein